MTLSEDLATRDIAGRYPWHDQRPAAKPDNKETRVQLAEEQARRLMDDRKWHQRSELTMIGKALGVSTTSLIDRLGCYEHDGWVIRAMYLE